jgi:hypothetical protein
MNVSAVFIPGNAAVAVMSTVPPVHTAPEMLSGDANNALNDDKLVSNDVVFGESVVAPCETNAPAFCRKLGCGGVAWLTVIVTIDGM